MERTVTVTYTRKDVIDMVSAHAREQLKGVTDKPGTACKTEITVDNENELQEVVVTFSA